MTTVQKHHTNKIGKGCNEIFWLHLREDYKF